jgi:hypothetical protein
LLGESIFVIVSERGDDIQTGLSAYRTLKDAEEALVLLQRCDNNMVQLGTGNGALYELYKFDIAQGCLLKTMITRKI